MQLKMAGVLLASTMLAMPTQVLARSYATVAIVPDTLTVSLGEPVSTRLTITNNGSQPLLLDLGDDRVTNIATTTIQPDGNKIRFQPSPHEGIARIGRITIGPGKTYSQILVLNAWTAFDRTGRYQVRVEIVDPLQTPGDHWSAIPPADLSVNVGPRDALVLRKVCFGTLQSLLQARSYDDALGAATALGNIKDPIAVPFLQDAILHASYPVKGVLIEGLQSVGTPDAVKVLINLASTNSPLRPEARVSLERMLPNISDKQLKDEAQQVANAK